MYFDVHVENCCIVLTKLWLVVIVVGVVLVDGSGGNLNLSVMVCCEWLWLVSGMMELGMAWVGLVVGVVLLAHDVCVRVRCSW